MDVIVATYGADEWAERALTAARSVNGARVYVHHSLTATNPGDARNEAVDVADPDSWIVFLDGDDQLGLGYIDAMTAAATDPADVYAPALQLGDTPPMVLHNRDIVNGLNPCPIGTAIHRDTFERVGRFWNEPAWEDWSLFRRAVLAGGAVRFVPDATYIAASSPNGRNSTVRNPRQLRQQIIDSHTEWSRTL